MPTDARGLEVPEDPPDGALSGTIWSLDRRRVAATSHLWFEGGAEVSVRTILESYDRNEHPWMHGRRPHDLVERYGDVLERAGFGVGLVFGALLYGPGRVAEKTREWWSR